MTKATTIREIYKCLLRDAKDLQRTPQFRLRNALRLEQWGTGHFIDAQDTTSSSSTVERGNDATRNIAGIAAEKTKLADIRSLEQYLTLREEGFGYSSRQEADLVQIIRESFRDNINLKDTKVRWKYQMQQWREG